LFTRSERTSGERTGPRYRLGQGAAFDAEHDALLRRIAPDSFTVRHRLDARFFSFG
jgi:hypothetical protein